MEEMVTMSVVRYAELIRTEKQFDILTNCLMNGATLGYNGTYLRFSDDDTNAIIRALFPNAYKNKLNELAKAKEEEEGAVNG